MGFDYFSPLLLISEENHFIQYATPWLATERTSSTPHSWQSMISTCTICYNDAELSVHHEDEPIYESFVKSYIAMGHFVYFCFPDHSNRVVGQLLQRSNRSPNNAVVNMYLPLYHPGTQQHINSPLILPHSISHGSLEGGTELV